MNPRIDVIVVLWKSLPFLEALFTSFTDVGYPEDRVTIHIVDNASPDGAGAEVKRRLADPDPRWPKIILHEPGANTGFAGGNNLVLRQSTAEYCYLLNHDAALTPGTLREAVAVAEAHPQAGAIQSLLVLMESPNVLNSTGNRIHFAGFGYCDGYLDALNTAPVDPRPISFASGAGVLYRTSALKNVGVLDETLFAYHEDLELGWRLWLAGFPSLLAPKSILRHHYEFSRSIQKWYWMERNRWIVMLTHYRVATLILLTPALVAIECMVWISALMGGWGKEKARVAGWFLHTDAWRYLAKKRHAMVQLRTAKDRDILKHFVAIIAHQDGSNTFVEKVANPLMRIYFAVLKWLVRW